MEHTGSPRSALSYLGTLSSRELDEALLNALSSHPSVSYLLPSPNTPPVSDTECTVSQQTAKKVFGHDLYLSQSRIDKFVNCNFSYYCSYVLKLREEQISRFKANDIGTFIHHVLESLLGRITNGNGIVTDISQNDIAELTKTIVEDYIKLIYPAGMTVTGRLEHLYKKLYNLCLVLIGNIISEFAHSSFNPEFFELKTDGKGDNPSAMELELSDGRRIIFSGIIDRVDIFKSENKVYIRVVDYKTGTKEFSLEDVKHGLNVQMLLYLFTLTKNKNGRFKEKIGGEPMPAGVVYLSSNIATVDLEDYEDEKNVLALAEKKLQRSGIILDDPDVLEAMNDQLSPDILLGARKRADGTVTGKWLTSSEAFQTLQKDIEDTLKKIGERMISGSAHASPLSYGGKDACKWCPMKPVCRRDIDRKGESYGKKMDQSAE